MSDYIQSRGVLGAYEQVENNPYVFAYDIGIYDWTAVNKRSPFQSNKWLPGDSIDIDIFINMSSNTPLPTVSFYMRIENTGQVILIDTIPPSVGFGASRGYFYIKGEQMGPYAISFSQNPLTTLVHAWTTFILQSVMKDVNGNPVYVYGPVTIYATITTPGGVFITKQVVGNTVYIPTRIVNLKVSPNPATTGQPITISGQLQRLTPNGQWIGVPDQVVTIYNDGNAVTDSNGNFSATITAPQVPGAYTYQAFFNWNDKEFLGESESSIVNLIVILPAPTSSTSTTVVQPTTSKPAPQPSNTTTPLIKPGLSARDLAILLGGAGLLTGIAAYKLSKKGKA